MLSADGSAGEWMGGRAAWPDAADPQARGSIGSRSWGRLCRASWAKFETQAPELAEVAARLWPGVVGLRRSAAVPQGAPFFAICYIATVRRDGGPRSK
jgi:hypothetical protein